ncbi:hypothetical protein BGX26_012392 [Mortierella sp. AD094]|nr:hypothetical protein BGX26_012392 [Mortierella sp. AD094]
MATVPEMANADPTKEVDKARVHKFSNTNKDSTEPTDLLATNTSLVVKNHNGGDSINRGIKKEIKAGEALMDNIKDLGKTQSYHNAHKQPRMANTVKESRSATPIMIKPEETIVYAVPSIVGSEQIKQEQERHEQERSLLSSQLTTGLPPPVPNADPLAAILSDPLTARLLETIQPFLVQRATNPDPVSDVATDTTIDPIPSSTLEPKQEAAHRSTQDTSKGTALGVALDGAPGPHKLESKHPDMGMGAAVDLKNRTPLNGSVDGNIANVVASTAVSEAEASMGPLDSSLNPRVPQTQVDQVLSKRGDGKISGKQEPGLEVKEGSEGGDKRSSDKVAVALISSDIKVSSKNNQEADPAGSAMSQETMVSDAATSADMSVLEPSEGIKQSQDPSSTDVRSSSVESDMEISSDDEEVDHIAVAQTESACIAESTIANANHVVEKKEGSAVSTKLTTDGAPKVETYQAIETVKAPASDSVSSIEKHASEGETPKTVSKILTGYQAESEPIEGTCDMEVDGPQTVPEVKPSFSLRPTAIAGAMSSITDGQPEHSMGDRILKRRQRSCSSPSLSSQIGAGTQQGHRGRHQQEQQQQSYPSWHFVPGSDLALLSEMAASNADLNRFRRESVWLEERVRRPRRDADSENVLDKALGLTRNVPHPNQENRGRSNSNSGSGVADSAVRLSSESRVAFSILKTNLLSDLEEQTRLETDYQTLQRALERMQVKIVEKQKLQQEAEQQIQEVVNRQSELELELQKVREQEEACLRQRELQRKQAENEIMQLEATLRMLQQQQQQGQEHRQEQGLLQT